MENHILKANKIVKQYGDYFALNNVDLSIPRGSVFGLLGPNGAGKTTLMRIINQIIAADSERSYLMDLLLTGNIFLKLVIYQKKEDCIKK